jgi:hypothetical protein
VLSTPGKVYLFEPADGRVGVLDASRNTLRVIGKLPPGVGQPAGINPLIAEGHRSLWLVTSPGILTRFDLTKDRPSGTTELTVPDRAEPPTTTRVTTSGNAVMAVSEAAGAYVLSRVNSTTGREEETELVAAEGPITGLAADRRSVWILTATLATRINSRTLRVTSRVSILPATPTVQRGAAVTNAGLWTLGRNGSLLLRVDLATLQTTTPLQILPQIPSAFREPVSVVSGDGRVWAMVQRTTDPEDHSVRVAAVDALTGKPTKAVDFPTELFIGAIAIT